MAKKSTAVIQPNLGIYYDRARIALNARMLSDGLNFRVKDGKLSNANMGWERFGTFILNGPVLMIADFVIRGVSEQLVFATDTDLYRYVDSDTVEYLSPRYETGTASRSGTAVTFAGGADITGVKTGDQIFFGATGQNDPDAAWEDIASVTDATHLVTTQSGTVASGAYTIRKRFTGGIQDIWQYDIFVNASPSTEDELWITNGVDDIVRWNGTDDQVEVMSSLGFKAKTLTVYDNMMVFGNLTQSGTRKPSDIINSNVGEPQNVSSGLSEQFKVHGHVDEIRRLVPLGQNLAIYSFTHDGVVTLASFVGDPFIFTFLQVSHSIGPVSGRAFADFGNYHEFIGRDTQYYFDGATLKPNNKHIWREILRQQDPARINFTYSHFDYENGDLIWTIPLTSDAAAGTTGAPSTANVEHYLEDPGSPSLPTPYSRRTFPFTATGYFQRNTGITWDQLTTPWSQLTFRWNDRFFFSSFPLNLAGGDDGKLYSINTVQNADGVALNSYVRFARRAVVDGRMRGLITRVYPFITSFTTPINVTLEMMDSAEASSQINDAQSFPQTLEEGAHFTTHYRRGRFFEVEFGTNTISTPWEIAGYDYDVRAGGKR